MHLPDYYINEDLTDIYNFVKENGFGILTHSYQDKVTVTHVPMMLETEPKPILHGHLAKANPQWKHFEENPEVLAVFNGPHAYISSSWYDHENVPTWNYAAVHIRGKVRLLNKEESMESITKLVDKYEQTQENPIRVQDLSQKTMRMMNAIVFFEIEIEKIEAIQKMSQNRDNTNYERIIYQLEKTQNPSDQEVARLMKKIRNI